MTQKTGWCSSKPLTIGVWLAYIKQRLGLNNEETVFQIQENAYMQFILGFHGYSIHVPLDTSRMVNFR